MKLFKVNNLKNIKSIYFFWGGVFLLASAPIFATFSFVIASLSKSSQSKSFLKDRWNLPLLIITILMIIGSLYIKFDPTFILLNNDSWDSNLLIYGLFNWIPFFLFFWAFQSFLQSKKQRYICAVLLIASTIPVLLTGYAQYWFGVYGPFKAFKGLIIWYQRDLADNISGMTGLFNNPNYAAAWLSISLPFTLSFIKLNEQRFFLKLISILLSLSIFFGMIFTHSRSAIGCIFITLIFLNFILDSSNTKKLIYLTLLISFFSALIINNLDFVNIVNSLEIFKRNLDNLDLNRIDIWRYTLESIFNRPLLGWGSGSFQFLITDITNTWKGHPHNILLELFFSYGIIVGLIFSLFLIRILIISFKNLFLNSTFNLEITDKTWFCSTFVLITTQMFDIQYFDFRISFSFWILLAGLKNICTSKEKLDIVKI